MEDQALRDAQYRKSLSIAYFNSVNSAIELAKVKQPEDIKEFIKEWRDWFIEEHKEHYLKSVAQIGLKYDKDATIKLLQASKDFNELQAKWVAISQDERNDPDIRSAVVKIRKQYENA